MKIFLTVGTQLPFDRLVRTMDNWIDPNSGVSVFGQIGDTDFIPENFAYEKHLRPDQFDSRFDEADLIISHAGMGTIITSLVKGKRLILFPRNSNYGEHRNDHQIATARHFETRGFPVAFDEKELVSHLSADTVSSFPPISDVAEGRLIYGLFEYLNN